MIVSYIYMGIPLPGLEAGKHQIEVADGANIQAFVDQLTTKYPALSKGYLKRCTIMVNGEKSECKRVLHDDDKILLLTVLGGG